MFGVALIGAHNKYLLFRPRDWMVWISLIHMCLIIGPKSDHCLALSLPLSVSPCFCWKLIGVTLAFEYPSITKAITATTDAKAPITMTTKKTILTPTKATKTTKNSYTNTNITSSNNNSNTPNHNKSYKKMIKGGHGIENWIWPSVVIE